LAAGLANFILGRPQLFSELGFIGCGL